MRAHHSCVCETFVFLERLTRRLHICHDAADIRDIGSEEEEQEIPATWFRLWLDAQMLDDSPPKFLWPSQSNGAIHLLVNNFSDFWWIFPLA